MVRLDITPGLLVFGDVFLFFSACFLELSTIGMYRCDCRCINALILRLLLLVFVIVFFSLVTPNEFFFFACCCLRAVSTVLIFCRDTPFGSCLLRCLCFDIFQSKLLARCFAFLTCDLDFYDVCHQS